MLGHFWKFFVISSNLIKQSIEKKRNDFVWSLSCLLVSFSASDELFHQFLSFLVLRNARTFKLVHGYNYKAYNSQIYGPTLLFYLHTAWNEFITPAWDIDLIIIHVWHARSSFAPCRDIMLVLSLFGMWKDVMMRVGNLLWIFSSPNSLGHIKSYQ